MSGAVWKRWISIAILIEIFFFHLARVFFFIFNFIFPTGFSISWINHFSLCSNCTSSDVLNPPQIYSWNFLKTFPQVSGPNSINLIPSWSTSVYTDSMPNMKDSSHRACFLRSQKATDTFFTLLIKKAIFSPDYFFSRAQLVKEEISG